MKSEKTIWIASGLLVWALWLAWLWQPERQLRLHQQHLLKAMESRNWNAFSRLLADGYSDRWGGTKPEMVGMASDALRHFFVLSVQGEILEQAQREGRIVERVKISGRGSAIADLVMERVNTLASPFVFTWAHRSWQPWDWQLTRVEQPELQVEIPAL